MYRFDAAAYHKALYVLVEAIGIVRLPSIEFAGKPLGDAASKSTVAQLVNLAEALDTLNVPITKIAIREFKEKLEDQSKFEVTFSQDWKVLTEISETLRRELTAAMIFVVDSAKASNYEPTKPHFGHEVAIKFPGLAYDISEAGKCLALDRSTAAAFHAIRSLEGGITAMSRCLGIADPTKGADRNWGSMLTKMKAAIDRRWPTGASRFSGDGQTFEELYAAIAGLQNPYRNATMHFDQIYTAEDAKHVFDVVGGILRKIASRMDENGLPQA
jgi:hypothetical protein